MDLLVILLTVACGFIVLFTSLEDCHISLKIGFPIVFVILLTFSIFLTANNKDKIIKKTVITTCLEVSTEKIKIKSEKPITYILEYQTYKSWSTFGDSLISIEVNGGVLK